jgi:voltage-gated potassium channel
VFAAEYVIKLYLAPNRRRFVVGHIPDLIIVVVPMLRPLRVLRSVRLLRLLRLAVLGGLAAKGLREARGILRHWGLNWVLLIVLVLNLVAAAMVLEFERGNPQANIGSYPDALWWAVTTTTTVGYGDRFPMSPAGRGVAVVLMVAGIAMFGVITATIAAYFVEQRAEEDLAGRLDQVVERLDRIEARLAAGDSDHAMAEPAWSELETTSRTTRRVGATTATAPAGVGISTATTVIPWGSLVAALVCGPGGRGGGPRAGCLERRQRHQQHGQSVDLSTDLARFLTDGGHDPANHSNVPADDHCEGQGPQAGRDDAGQGQGHARRPWAHGDDQVRGHRQLSGGHRDLPVAPGRRRCPSGQQDHPGRGQGAASTTINRAATHNHAVPNLRPVLPGRLP